MAVAEVEAGFWPNMPPALDWALLPAPAPPALPNKPPALDEVVAAGCVVDSAVVAAGLDAALPNRLLADDVGFAALAKRFEACFVASVGGAPAGVVEAMENIGFAGVDVAAPAAAKGLDVKLGVEV